MSPEKLSGVASSSPTGDGPDEMGTTNHHRIIPHQGNVEALAELLFRVEHVDLGIAPPFELLPGVRQDLYRRRARFLSTRGVVVPGAVAAELRDALGALAEDVTEEQIRAMLESIARGEPA